MITIVALLLLAAWLYLLTFHGRFWRSSPSLPAAKPAGPAKVAVVVPARNEAENIGQSIASLLAQDYPGEFSIILVDDNSTDQTAKIATALDTSGRLIIVNGEPLPTGWSGKLWAVHQGLAQERTKTSDYVLLTDADIVHEVDHLASLVAKAQAEKLDLVSEMVRLHCETPAERTLIPAFVFFFQMLYPFAWVNDPRRQTAGAAGGTILVARTALDLIGGISRIRHHLIDDCALAKEIKSADGRLWLGHAERATSIRIYSAWRDVWNMIARTAYVQLNHSPLLLLGCLLGMGLVYCAPPALAFLTGGIPRSAGILAWSIMALLFQPTLRRYRRSPLWGFALPVIALFYLCATVASALRHHSGRGGGWKNRVYPESAPQ